MRARVSSAYLRPAQLVKPEGGHRCRDDFLRVRRAQPEAIGKTATRNELPVDRITQVRVLDPYFHH
jgi:hypothetical protein